MTTEARYAFDWVRHHARTRPDAPAIGGPERPWTTYAELDAGIDALGATLRGAGVGEGDFVVMAISASAVSVAVGLAVQALGAVCVEVSRELGDDAFAEILRQTGSRAAVVEGRDVVRWSRLAGTSDVAHLLVLHPSSPPPAMRTKLGDVAWTWIPDRLDAVSPAADGAGADVPERIRRDPDAAALLVYTSGSTGVPRAVIQTIANIDANTRAIVDYLELTAADRAMATLPLFYCYGRSILQTHLFVGGSVFFDHRFMYPAVVMREIAVQGCTSFAGVPLTFESLRRRVDIAATDTSSLRYVTQAGGAMHPDTIQWVREAFSPAVLFIMYGQTEATSRLSYLPPDRAVDKAGSVGRGLINVELRVVDEHGAVVPPGVVGDVVARGPSITPGYFGAPEETQEILRDGWLHTGDLGRVDEEGFLFLAGRTKEFMKLAGNRVSGREIEEVLARHAGVDEVAVVGMTDADGAEQAVAYVVAVAGVDVDEATLRRFCRDTLPAFKVPRFVRFVDALPLTASKKIARSELQEWTKHDPTLLEGRAGAGSGGQDR